MRCVILVRNFTTQPDFNFEGIVSVDRIPFLGEDVTVVGEAVTSNWQWLSTVCGLLFAVFVLDATVALWLVFICAAELCRMSPIFTDVSRSRRVRRRWCADAQASALYAFHFEVFVFAR